MAVILMITLKRVGFLRGDCRTQGERVAFGAFDLSLPEKMDIMLSSILHMQD